MESVQQRESGQTKAKTGLYLYCIIQQPANNGSFSGFADTAIKGIGDLPLYMIAHRDLAVVVGHVQGERQQATRSNLLRHSEVLEQIMQYQQLLPIRFGIVADGEEEVVNNVLKANYWNFSELLKKLEGKRELGLKIIWDQQSILQHLVETDAQIRQLRDSLVGRTDNAAYHEKIKLGRMLDAALSQWKADLSIEVLEALAPLADEHRENKLLTENMILNTAFLVPTDRVPEFENCVNGLGDKYDKLLTFKYTDVAPPYNFVNLTIKL